MNSLISALSYLQPRKPFEKLTHALLRFAKAGPIRTPYGFRIQFERDNPSSMGMRQMILDGSYEHDDMLALKPFATDTVIDVGAHEGFVSLYLARFAKKVVACEPNPENLRFLKNNVALNPNCAVEITPQAIADSSGEMALMMEPGEGSGSSLIQYGHQSKALSVPVGVTTLDDLNIGTKVSLIKIDTEGSELEVLRGAEKLIDRDHPTICVEANLTLWAVMPRSIQEVLDFLKDRNYSLYQVAKRGQLIPFRGWFDQRVQNLFAVHRTHSS